MFLDTWFPTQSDLKSYPHIELMSLQEERGEELEQDPEGSEVGGGRDRETPWGASVEVTRVRGDATPQRKTRTSRDSPQNVSTCC